MTTPLVIAYGNDSTTNICQVLARLDLNYAVLTSNKTPWFGFTHVILSGGPDHVNEPNSMKLPKWLDEDIDKPVLGVCYGMQLIVKYFGGEIVEMDSFVQSPVPVYENEKITNRWMYHLDKIGVVPDKFTITGMTDYCVASIRKQNWIGIQYHPENPKYVDSSVFANFLNP